MNVEIISPGTIEEWIQEVLRLNEQYYTLIEVESEQALGPPNTEERIRQLEDHVDYRLPPSYRMFLSLHDGWNNWEGDERLLSIGDFYSGRYFEQVRKIKQFAWDEGISVLVEGIVVGVCLTSASLLLLDPTRTDERGEMEIVNWEHTEVERFPDFLKLLQDSAVDLRIMIQDEELGIESSE
jgi:hypothetical protein